MKRRTALAIVLALIVFVGVWVFVYFVEMSNTTRAVVWLVACVVILASQWIVLSGSKHLGGYLADYLSVSIYAARSAASDRDSPMSGIFGCGSSRNKAIFAAS